MRRMARKQRWWRVVAAALAAAAALFALGVWNIHSAGPWPFSHADIQSVEAHPDGSLVLFVMSRNGAPETEQLVETDGEVRVGVSATQYLRASGDCLDTVDVQLEAPLGERVVIDLVADRPVADVTFVSD